jgi:hypothetical protein
MKSAARALVLALAVCGLASGCAQWQAGPDSLAASLDEPLLAHCFDALSDRASGTSQSDSATLLLTQPSAPDSVIRAAAHQESPSAVRSPKEKLRHTPADVEAAIALLDATVDGQAQPDEAVSDASMIDDGCCGQEKAASTGLTCPLVACGRCYDCMAGRICKRWQRPEPGPPPVRYLPPMPPKFLPVPTCPTLSPARPDAPEPWRGDVEFGYRPQVTFPARD